MVDDARVGEGGEGAAEPLRDVPVARAVMPLTCAS